MHAEFCLEKNGFQRIEFDLLILSTSTQESLEQYFPNYVPCYTSLQRCFSKKECLAETMVKPYTWSYFLKKFIICIIISKHLKSPAVKSVHIICFK